MKKISYFFIVMLSLFMMTMTSCVNNLEGNKDNLPSNVASLQDQVTAMKSSVLELESIQTKLNEVAGFEEYVALFEDCATSVEEHVGLVENGLSGANAAIAAMKLQGQIADAAGTVKAALALAGNDDFQKDMMSLEKSVSAWLGKDFKNYYGVAAEQARLRLMLKTVASQTIAVEALASDVEAGLRVGDASSLEPTLESVNKSSASLSSLDQKISSFSVEIEEEYTEAIKAETSASKSALKAVNTKAVSLLSDAVPTLDELASRIAACETEIVGLKERLTQVETDIEKLLGLIQSVTFLSDFSEEKAIAYYTLNSAVVDSEGRQGRTPAENIQLNYLIRPASAVTALADMESWSANGVEVSVQGYFADMIEVKSFDKEFVDFTINSVTADSEKGLLTINASSAALTEDFFMKNVGAKLALSIQSATTDIASKFVEIVPRDQSGNVYIESMTLDARSLEIKQGDTDKLTATLTPSGVTVTGCDWSSSVPEVASIDENGNITANIVGTTVITATTKGTNEWGQKLTATCNIKVAPNVKIIRPQAWVETYEDAYFTLQMSDNFAYTKIEWSVSNNLATIDNSGKLTGVDFFHDSEYAKDSGTLLSETYRPTTVYCKIYNGGTEPEVILEESITVVAKQPRGIDISGLSAYDDPNRITLKFNQELNLGTMSVTPAVVNSDISSTDDHFYVSAYSVDDEAPITYKNGTVTAKSTIGETVMRFVVSGKTKWWAPDHSVNRWVTFAVEPYYVKTMTLPTIVTLNPGNTTQISPEFTSDVDGHQPSYPEKVEWSIVVDDEFEDGVIALNGNTIEALKVGQAKVRVTTTGENTTEDGNPISAECIVMVEEKAADAAKMGDYYYSDGTYSTDLDTDKTVVGVVFSTTNATYTDSQLATDHPSCSHGLVICKTEYTKEQGGYRSYKMYDGILGLPEYFEQDSWPIPSSDVSTFTVMGYCQTLALKGYKAYRNDSSVLTFVDAVDEGPAFNFATDKTNSGWYIPSYAEMSILRDAEVLSVVNSSLTAISGNGVSDSGVYWISTAFDNPTDAYSDLFINPYNMSTGTWNNTSLKNVAGSSTTYPVRLVLAF